LSELTAKITSKGRLTVPVAVRRHLGLGPHDRVAFVIEGDDVRLCRLRYTLESVIGSVEPLPGTTTADFARQIAEAAEEQAERTRRTDLSA
jgi:AbrB family looped-hinge helix DNA binding protein